MRKIEEKIMDTMKGTKEGLYNLSCRDSVEISHTVESNKKVVRVFLHGNMIYQQSAGKIRLSSCGWTTNTTKARLNAILSIYGISISQKNWVWKIHTADYYTTKAGEIKNNFEFYDGIVFDISHMKVE
jgi:hypothetical protein